MMKKDLTHKKIWYLSFIPVLFFFLLAANEVKGQDIWKELIDNNSHPGKIPPEASLLLDIRKTLPDWAATSSRAYTNSLYEGPPAWQLILNRPTARQAAKKTNIYNAFLLIYMVQERENAFPEKLKHLFSWDLPESEVEIYTIYLGKAKGYYWYAKGDIFHINILRNFLNPTGGENFNKIMAYALNKTDFDHFTARTAILYFRNRKDDSPVYILEAAEEWKKEKSDPPYQHLEAIKLCGGKTAGKILTKIARSSDKGLARKAIDHLLESPELAEESFLRKLIFLPEYTATVLEIFAQKNNLPVLLPDLEKIMQRPRSILQYAISFEAHRKITGKITTVPEINAASHIRLRMVRLGDTKDSTKFIPLDEKGANELTDKAERKRIQIFMDLILNSKDTEASIVAALLLASLDQGNERFLNPDYIKRVHKVGIELLQKLPPANVRRTVEKLYDSVRDKNSRIYLENIAKELGVRQ